MQDNYSSVPPRRTRTIRVKYKYTGRIEPLRYMLDNHYQVNINEYKELVESLLEQILELTETYLPYKGDTCEFSQKVCIVNAIAEVNYCINSLEDKDFIDDLD